MKTKICIILCLTILISSLASLITSVAEEDSVVKYYSIDEATIVAQYYLDTFYREDQKARGRLIATNQ